MTLKAFKYPSELSAPKVVPSDNFGSETDHRGSQDTTSSLLCSAHVNLQVEACVQPGTLLTVG